MLLTQPITKVYLLDLLLTRKSNPILLSKPVVKNTLFSNLRGNVSGDQKGFCSVLKVSKPETPKKQVSFRQYGKTNTKDPQ